MYNIPGEESFFNDTAIRAKCVAIDLNDTSESFKKASGIGA